MLTYETIKKLCKNKGVTVTGLEKELGFARGSLCKVDTNKPSMEKVEKLADYFNVSVNYLINGEEPERLYLDIKDIEAMKRGIVSLGYTVSFEFSRNYGYTLVVNKKEHSQSIAFRNDEIIKYLSCLNFSNLETIENAIEEKYANEQYYENKSEEHIIDEVFNSPNTSDPAYLSTVCDTWVSYPVNNANENSGEEYYLNIETAQTAQQIFEEDRVLFDVYRSADKERLVEYAKKLKALRDMEEGEV